MTNHTDSQLLKIYAEQRFEPAFAELVRRYVDFVYSAAMRMVRDPHHAQDVTQGVFIALVRQAPDLFDRPTLAGWLHRTAQNIAAQTVRSIERRRTREQKAVAMNELLATAPEASWEQIQPHLDDALGELNDADRDAVLLRYFQKKSAAEIAVILGVSDDAAQKRVTRAVERLREFFVKRGGTVGTGGLVVIISANAVQAAPAGMVVTISAAAFAGTSLTLAPVAMTTLQKIAVTAALAATVGVGIYQAKEAHDARAEMQTVQARQAPLAGRLRQLSAQHAKDTNMIAWLKGEVAKNEKNNQELLKLRGQLGMLNQNALELSNRIKFLEAPKPYGLTMDQLPPIAGGSVEETGEVYARFIRDYQAGNLTTAEEYYLIKSWPYLESRFPEPEGFSHFQSEYINSLLSLTNNNTKWRIRQILEQARNEEHAHGLRWVRDTDEELSHYPQVLADMPKIRKDWNLLNEKTVREISDILPDSERETFLSNFSLVLDFDPRLKKFAGKSLDGARFKNLTVQEVEDVYYGGNKPFEGTPLERQP